jgi:hypothetical protein
MNVLVCKITSLLRIIKFYRKNDLLTIKLSLVKQHINDQLDTFSMVSNSSECIQVYSPASEEFVELVTPIVNLLKRILSDLVLASDASTEATFSMVKHVLENTCLLSVLGEILILLY